MIVVVLVGVLTVMALPTMAEGRYNARTFDNATQIAELYSEARTRSIGRGAAMLVTMTSGNQLSSSLGASDMGTFTLYEAQAANLGGYSLGSQPLPGGSPLSSCGPPATNWTTIIGNATNTLIDVVNLNDQGNWQAQIWTTLADGSGTTPTKGSLCYTPLGRTYYLAGNATTPTFLPGVNVLHGELQITVQRSGTSGAAHGLKRTVIIPDSGSTRIVSQ